MWVTLPIVFSVFRTMLPLWRTLLLAVLVTVALADCNTAKQQCQSDCAGESMNFSCQSVNGITQSHCQCVSGGEINNEGLFIVVVIFLQACCCLVTCTCIVICVRLAVSAIGLALICDFLILVDSMLGVISIKGAIGAIWDTITDSAGLSTITIIQLVVPLIIVVMCYANTVPTNIIALILCVITIILQIAYFSVLFSQSSIVPYVGTISVGVGVLIIGCTIGIMLRVIQTLRELQQPNTVYVNMGDPYSGQGSLPQLSAYGSTNDAGFQSGGGYPQNGSPWAPMYGSPAMNEYNPQTQAGYGSSQV